LSREKKYSIGIINIVPSFEEILVGFKEGMTELGYIEGRTITYIY
jgi:hypothetical protein